MNYDTFSRNTRNQLNQLLDALRELITPLDLLKRPIGFISPEDKGKKASSQAKRKTSPRGLADADDHDDCGQDRECEADGAVDERHVRLSFDLYS